MKIARIIINRFNQFQDFDLDLTDPRTGEPLEKVCFIGRNGTGKSTLLRLIYRALDTLAEPRGMYHSSMPHSCFIKVVDDTKKYWIFDYGPSRKFDPKFVREAFEKTEAWARIIAGDVSLGRLLKESDAPPYDQVFESGDRALRSTKGDLVIYSPPGTESLDPSAGREQDKRIIQSRDLPVMHVVRTEQLDAFWDVVLHHIDKLQQGWLTYLEQPENRTKTVAELEAAFQKSHPEILVEIAALWNEILHSAGLEFDYQTPKEPVRGSKRLEAYIKVRETGQRVEYGALSSGTRKLICCLGHILSLYFGRTIESGFLLVDEPENSLFPDLLYDLVDNYLRIIRNTQFFVATHNPIVAAQFCPHERVILEFDEQYHVKPRRGVTPVGDDPNDVLAKDFDVRSIYGREGLAKWERFLQLRRVIKQTADPAERLKLINEYTQIGNAYNFAADGIPSQDT
jgi:energy-coupling factor transporter ATP-binding protein EcfA2